ncbi:transcriptional regulator [Aspergillus bombycis]|uniref:Transcriptional regulator n=1 Tax=Aspergillus bombycis TaxID=109264 RepID=A0A1F7ZIJ3_9EURO|nr:transcriptional regulator [Aspergillus bombycis]OGM39273.1 transcriptional regulator [Aspergillus bombycis]
MAPRRRVVSDSESESDEPAAPSAPSNDALEKALRETVAKIYKLGNMEELTVKRVRMAAEKSLGVEEGFFKGSSTWKSKSDQIIKDEVAVQDKQAQEPESDEEPEEPAPPAKKASSAKRTKLDKAEASRKRRKTSTPEPEDQSESSAPLDDESEEEVKRPAKKQSETTLGKNSKSKPSKELVSDDSEDVEDQKDDVAPSEEAEEPKNDRGEDSESEMSVVLDEEPKPTRKRQKSAGTEASTQKRKKTTTTSKAKDADLDPDQKKIKELQDLLVKCGIRKLWWRLLAPYETSKEKIGHLEGMLREAGMIGPLKGKEAERKALKIRERRELQADVVSCQEEVRLYGKGDADEESDSGRPGRRLNRGRKHLAFLEDDGEETD